MNKNEYLLARLDRNRLASKLELHNSRISSILLGGMITQLQSKSILNFKSQVNTSTRHNFKSQIELILQLYLTQLQVKQYNFLK